MSNNELINALQYYENKAMPELRNYMEVCVSDLLDTVISGTRVCGCEKCRYDITAIALNKLPPKYVVTRKGEIYTKLISLQQQFDVDILTAITQAAGIVSKHPRHEK